MQYTDWFAHHGIKGQKWGVRNGPPYPLDKKVSKKTKYRGMHEINEIAQRALAISSFADNYLTPELGVLGAGAYGAFKIGKSLKNKTQYGSQLSTEFKAKQKATSSDDDMIRVNANNRNEVSNCTYCTTAYDLRKRGYDVEAGRFTRSGGGETLDVIKKWYPDSKRVNVSEDAGNYRLSCRGKNTDYAKNIIQSLSSQPNSRGNLMVKWSEYAGHSLAYEVDESGLVTIRDCQSGTRISNALNLLSNVMEADYFRLDNCEPNLKLLKERGVVHDCA